MNKNNSLKEWLKGTTSYQARVDRQARKDRELKELIDAYWGESESEISPWRVIFILVILAIGTTWPLWINDL